MEQGTVLDSVEYNVQQTSRELVAAESELKEAARYQANTGRRKCILFLILIIVGLIIVLIYKPRGIGNGEVDSGVGKHTPESIATVSAGVKPSGMRLGLPYPKPTVQPIPTSPVVPLEGEQSR